MAQKLTLVRKYVDMGVFDASTNVNGVATHRQIEESMKRKSIAFKNALYGLKEERRHDIALIEYLLDCGANANCWLDEVVIISRF